jgi:hypothetical protein
MFFYLSHIISNSSHFILSQMSHSSARDNSNAVPSKKILSAHLENPAMLTCRSARSNPNVASNVGRTTNLAGYRRNASENNHSLRKTSTIFPLRKVRLRIEYTGPDRPFLQQTNFG